MTDGLVGLGTSEGEIRSLDVFVPGDRVHRLVGTAVPKPEHEPPRHLSLWHDYLDDAGRS